VKRIILLLAILGFFALWMNETVHVSTVDNIVAKILPSATPEQLVEIQGSKVLMQNSAADAFVLMREAAKKDGVSLIPHSGYRSVSTQQYLWNKYLKKYGAKYTAKVLKPPGESEHQTGYAIDIDDGNNLKCSLQRCFKDGSAYKWLTENASKYNFEISYPEGNPEGITFEPWHWRFIGTPEAIKILKN
jgi:D-alanyl-D-alanine carboxypeptidase